MKSLRIGLRLLRQDWRSGELYLLAAALVLTVAAITAVGFFTDRVERAMQRQGGELIAADLLLDGSAPIPARFAEQARCTGPVDRHDLGVSQRRNGRAGSAAGPGKSR